MTTLECPICWVTFTPSRWNTSGCCSSRCGVRKRHGKLNSQDLVEMREMRAKGATYAAIAKAYGIHLSTAAALAR